MKAAFDVINLTLDLVNKNPILFDLYILIIICHTKGFYDILDILADAYHIREELQEMNMLKK